MKARLLVCLERDPEGSWGCATCRDALLRGSRHVDRRGLMILYALAFKLTDLPPS